LGRGYNQGARRRSGYSAAEAKYVPVAGGKAVFNWDEGRDKSTLVATTILDADMAL
jgi:hypothetical protein